MGYRLDGPKLAHLKGHNIVSDGTVNGSIQVPGSGQPIVLMRDRGTTGGYPKIATVIGPDLGLLAQRRVGESVRFAEIGIEEAETEARRFAETDQIATGPSAGRRSPARTSRRCTAPTSRATRSMHSTPQRGRLRRTATTSKDG